ncbi:MAG: CADD family putative folate metabolism protein [Thermoplasmata archaeon]|nr:CADD family putative folate metabolism protein [Thermoplasmata archaeon]MCI4354379.1 CADD family putative folate metabolism protein [Thermoplasmata archaeon]
MHPVAQLDALIRSRHLLKHPFYQAWSHGQVPMSTLQEYAGQYYHFESNFPRYVAGVYAKETDPARRRILLANLVDEEGRTPTHPELWSRFATAIGAPDPAREPHRAMGGTKRLMETYERFALDGSLAGGLGALYAYESIFPEVAHEKARGLKAHYGLQSPKALEFFTVHEEADKAHSAAERALLAAELKDSPARARSALFGAKQSLGAWWGFLDGFTP